MATRRLLSPVTVVWPVVRALVPALLRQVPVAHAAARRLAAAIASFASAATVPTPSTALVELVLPVRMVLALLLVLPTVV